MPPIRFETKLVSIGSWTILRLPASASAKLPSRGVAMVKGTINNVSFKAALEPDGKGSHWLRVDDAMSKAAKAKAGDKVVMIIEPTDDWIEVKIPADLKKAFKESKYAEATWQEFTTIARRDWIRWISATKNPETRKKRIGVALSKFKAGKKRPCCFNRSQCTVPDVSNNGVLLDRDPEKK